MNTWKRSSPTWFSEENRSETEQTAVAGATTPTTTGLSQFTIHPDLHQLSAAGPDNHRHTIGGERFSAPSSSVPDNRWPLASFVDQQSGLRIEVHHPLECPDRWRAYLDGAESRYRSHGVLQALDRPQLEGGRTTSLFFVAIDEGDRVVGGLRCHGPLRAASEAYALQELDGHAKLQVVRDTLADRVAAGVVELKGAWVDADFPRRGLSDALARCYVHAMNWFGTRYAICTCALTTAARWQSTGARPLGDFTPVSYPDGRYQTVLLWWDRRRVEQLSTPEQWSRLRQENDQLKDTNPSPARRAVSPMTMSGLTNRNASDTGASWRAEVLDDRLPQDQERLAAILADPNVELLDRWHEQADGLRQISLGTGTGEHDDAPRWVFYPWRRSLVRLLGPSAFRALRLDRNRNKITLEEQEKLRRLRIGVVGLSVGHSIAYTLALEGICGELRLADFDTIELSNLNRIPASVLDLGLNKTVSVSRRIAEVDPYLELNLVPEGITAANVDRFIDGLDVVVEECDSLDLKLLLREAARRARIPVLMETSDRGLLDVERFDLEPDRPLFHGLLGDVQASDLVGLSTHDKVPYVLRILEPAQLSSRMAASMAEIDETLATWPQLGGDVTLGAASVAAAIRRLGRGEHLPSGRVRVDLGAALDALSEPDEADHRHFAPPAVAPPPSDSALAVVHAAALAPSGGNSQPWSLRLDAGQLRLSLDRARTSTMDVCFRGSYVAIGAALLNARIAAAAHGILGSVEDFPEGEKSDLVATVNFEGRSDPELASLYPGLLDRSTNRRPGTPYVLEGAIAEELGRHVEHHGARLRLLTSSDDLEDYAELLGESDRLRYLSPVLHSELMGELRWPGHDRLENGIDVRTLELDDADLSKLSVARRADVMADLAAWDGGRALGEVTRQRVRSSSALAVITVPDARPRSYVAGGGAVQRMWLAAEAADLAVQPVSLLSVFAIDAGDFAGLVPGPYVARLQGLSTRLRGLAQLADSEALVLVLRISKADPPSCRSLRQPLPAVLMEHQER